MPIDASIPLGIKQPQFENPLNSLAKVMQIKGMQQESQMGQMKMDEYQRNVEDQNALRTELSQPGSDPYRALLNRGKIKEATEYQKGQNDSAKQKVDLIDAKLKQSRTFLDQVQTPEQFIEWHKANHADPVLGPELAARGVTAEQSMATIKQALSEPGGFQRLLQKSAMGLEKFTEANKPTTSVVNAGGTSQILQTPGLGGAPTLAGTIQHTQSPDSIASNATTRRGQTMTDERARDFNATQVEANNIKRTEKKETADLTKNSQIASFDTMLGTLDRLAKHPGLSRSVGSIGALPTMPGSNSANFQAELNTFQSQAFLPMVAQLKGMGALSDAEGKKLTAAVGALDPKMGEQAFRESVARITADMEAARERVAGSRRTPPADGGLPPDIAAILQKHGGK